jgi:hypothetical protein
MPFPLNADTLRERLQERRERGASETALRTIESDIDSLGVLNPRARDSVATGIRDRLSRLAVTLNLGRVRRQPDGLPVRVTCTTHPGVPAVGERWLGSFRQFQYLCEECFADAKEQDAAQATITPHSNPHGISKKRRQP